MQRALRSPPLCSLSPSHPHPLRTRIPTPECSPALSSQPSKSVSQPANQPPSATADTKPALHTSSSAEHLPTEAPRLCLLESCCSHKNFWRGAPAKVPGADRILSLLRIAGYRVICSWPAAGTLLGRKLWHQGNRRRWRRVTSEQATVAVAGTFCCNVRCTSFISPARNCDVGATGGNKHSA